MWRFGEFQADPAARELRCAGALVHVEPQAFDVLIHLIEHRDRVVSKSELLDEVWGHQYVSESNLTTRVKEVRRAVGDDGTHQHTIKNVRGRGYRFVASLGEDLVSSSGLIGRVAELTEIRAALKRSRVVTLVGPGGVGKSSLARVVAGDLESALAHGAPVVELAALSDGAHVLPALARLLGVVLDEDRTDVAIRSVASLDTLVVLDNCEHLATEVRATVEHILHVPGGAAHILATSQVPLGVSGETVVDVSPLDREKARELFLVRARAARHDWASVDEGRIDRLVNALDRLPLTIEMAAARIRSMTFDDLERVILGDDGPGAMTHRTTARRHRSVEALAQWSSGLLEPQHRRLFLEISMFAGAVTVDDATAVLAPGERGVVAAGLAELAERSLLVADVGRAETRYSMLSTVRAVASRWLDDIGPLPELRSRHADHVADVVARIDDALRTAQEPEGRRRLAEVADDVRAAHTWASQHRPSLASDLSGSLFHAAYSTLWSEPATWSAALVDPGHHGAALVIAGAAAHRGDLATARRGSEAVAAAASGRLRAAALELLADVSLYEGNLAGAAAAAEELRRLGDVLDDAHVATFAVVDSALVLAYGDDPMGALGALDSYGRTDLAPTDAAWLAYTRGEALTLVGDDDAAEAFRDAIAIGTKVANSFVTCAARISLASEHTRAGHVADALTEYAIALAVFRRHGNHTHTITAIRNLVGLLVKIGDDRSATLLAGAVSKQRRASYGVEAEQVRAALAEVTSRCGAAQVQSWLDEGGELVEAVDEVAAEIVERHGKVSPDEC